MVWLLNLIIQLKGARLTQKKIPLKYRLWFLDIITSCCAIHHSFYVSSHSTHQRPSSDDIREGYYMNARLMAQHINHNIGLILAIHVH